MNNYITTKEAQKLANRSKATIQRWVKNGWLHPINKDTYRRDGGYVFHQEDFDFFLQSLRTEMSLQEAANYIGITPQYLSVLRNNGEIKAEEISYGKQQRLSFTQEECDQWIRKRKHSPSYKGEETVLTPFANGLRLFSLIRDEYEKQGRVIQTAPSKVLWEDGNISEPPQETLPMDKWPDKPYVRQKGFSYFRFPIPRNPLHPVYDMLSHLISAAGPRNMKVIEEKIGNYLVRVRNSTLFATEEEYKMLKGSLIKGHVKWVNHQISIYSDQLPVTVYLSNQEKKIINTFKQEENSTGDILKTFAFRHLNSYRQKNPERNNIRAEMWWDLAEKNIFEGHVEISKMQILQSVHRRGYSQKLGESIWKKIITEKREGAQCIPYLLDAFLFNNERILMDQDFDYTDKKVIFALIEHIRRQYLSWS